MKQDKPRTDLNRSMNLSIVSGATGTLWMIVCSPQAIFNVFVKNHLGATSAQLGLLVGILSFASVLQLVSIVAYRRLPRRKRFWIVTSVIHRLNGPVLAVVAFWIFRGGNRQTGLIVIFAAMITSWAISNMSSSGWWSWMADLIPISVRARFFGRRSAVSQFVNIAAFFATTVVLDAVSGPRVFLVYGAVFLVAGAAGVADILVHVLIPEPRRNANPSAGEELIEPAVAERPDPAVAERPDPAVAQQPEPPVGFFAPLADRNFLRFSLVTGLVLFSINVSAPFFAPYITDPEAIGAPNAWLGIMFVISQLTWIAVSSRWGMIMDRFGRKPVVMIGLLFTLSWIGYLFLSPSNYVVVLPTIALLGGLLAPAFGDGINQLMLSLTPEKDRLNFIAWYLTIIGVVSAGGSLAGGLLDDLFRTRTLSLWVVQIEGFQVVVVTSLLLIGISVFALSRIDEGPVKALGFVFSRVANPGIFRTFFNIGVLARTDDSERVVKTLRSIESSSDDLAVEQVMERVNDPDPDVREEAIRALGRLRSGEATNILLEMINNPTSLNQVQVARALGRIGDKRAIPILVDAMENGSEDLREACAVAIGEIGGQASVRFLSDLLRRDQSDTVVAAGASAVSRHGVFEAAWEIVPRLHRTDNPVLRRQMAIALANILGRPGEFYRYVTGAEEQQEIRVRRLILDAERALSQVLHVSRENAAAAFALARTGEFYSAMQSLLNAVETQAAAPAAEVPADPGLGLWHWFLGQAVESNTASHENRRIEFLVACYFLKTRNEGNRDDRSPAKPSL